MRLPPRVQVVYSARWAVWWPLDFKVSLCWTEVLGLSRPPKNQKVISDVVRNDFPQIYATLHRGRHIMLASAKICVSAWSDSSEVGFKNRRTRRAHHMLEKRAACSG